MYINFTESAKHKLEEYASDQPDMNYLRLGVKSGGCSGLEYVVNLTEEKNQNDRVDADVLHSLDLIVDPKSYLYLKDLTIDWEDQGLNSGFKFENPNAKKSCGCGTSFQPG
jgi:iron-sulfur cluster assembly protein